MVPANVFEHAHCISVIKLNSHSHLNIFEAMRSALLLISHHLRISIGLRELPKLCPECLPETLETEYFGGAVSAVVCFSNVNVFGGSDVQVCLAKSLRDSKGL